MRGSSGKKLQKAQPDTSSAEEASKASISPGTLVRIAGPVVVAKGLRARMYDRVYVGKERLMGEVIIVNGDRATIQVYEDPSGLRPGEAVQATGEPLSVELRPGLITSVYDGVQRPLPLILNREGEFITPPL